MTVRQKMLLCSRTLRLRFCRRNGARTFFRLRRRREFLTLRVLIAETRDLSLVLRLLFGPFGRSLLPLLDGRFVLFDGRFLLHDRYAHLGNQRPRLQGRKLLQIIAIKNAHR